MAVYERPGVFQPEQDLSQVVRESASDTGVIVAAFPRGPINKRILITNTKDSLTLFGNPDPAFGYGQYMALCALETMNKLYMTRVVSTDALASGVLINQDGSVNLSDILTTGLIDTDQDLGIDTLYQLGVGDGVLVNFAGTLPSISDILDITDIQVGGNSVGPLTVDKSGATWTIAGPGLSGTASTVIPSTGVISLVLASPAATGEEIDVYFTASSADRLFTVAAENPGVWGNGLKVTITDVNPLTYEFNINVFEVVDGIEILVESHTVSRKHQLDGFQRQQYLEDVVNGNSLYIRVYDNIEKADTVLPPEITSSVSLGGGDDGSAISNADLIAGWDLYANKQEVQIDILINSGYVSSTDTSVQSKMKSICESRDDCFAILDSPYSELSMFPTTDLTNWRLNTQNFNTSYSALYSPWCEVYDSLNDTRNFPIPPSGFVAQVFARRAKNTEAWFPPAGFNDGLVNSSFLSFTKLTNIYSEGQQDLLYRNGVNFLRTEPGTGTAVFGDKTQLTKASALDRINVRRLLNVLKRSMNAFLKFQLFELNTEITRAQITEVLTDFLKGIKARQGLDDFIVVCDSTNNTANVRDNNQLKVDIYLKPTRSINFIENKFILTRSGVDFQTIIDSTLPA